MIDDTSPHIVTVLLADPGTVVTLPAATYSCWMSKLAVEASAFSRARSVVPINPRSAYVPTTTLHTEGAKVSAFARWEFGVTPRGIIHALGLSEQLVDFVVRELVPGCVRCGCSMQRPRAVGELPLPAEGYVVITPVEVPEQVSVRDQCEMLGSERALIQRRIVRANEIADADGAPIVALISVSDREQLSEVAESWFGRGGGALAVYHAVSRDSDVVALDRISRQWTCNVCGNIAERPSRLRLADVLLCGTCRGEGWLLERSGRFVPCRTCDGFGSDDEIRHYKCGGVPLSRMAELSFNELRRIVENNAASSNESLLSALAAVQEFGFGEYPLVSPVGTLSEGERVMLTALIGELSCVVGARYVVDEAFLRGETLAGISDRARSSLRVVAPSRQSVDTVDQVLEGSGGVIRVTEIESGCLSIAEVTLPIGALSLVGGVAGTGKSLFLAELASRFARRKKIAHATSFGDLKRCHLVGPMGSSAESLLKLLSLDRDLAHEIARTRTAQLEGITVEDLSLESGRYRCAECGGSGTNAEAPSEERLRDIVCVSCGGCLYDWRVADLPLLGVTVADIVKLPLKECAQLLWQDPVVSEIIGRVAGELNGAACLATSSAELSQEQRGYFALMARLLRIRSASPRKRAQGRPLASDLVLVDGPRVLIGQHFEIVRDLLRDLVDSGATVICADLPRGLESMSASVLRLHVDCEGRMAQSRRSFLDSRFARVSLIERDVR